ncbi:MAG TPA: ferrous iron transport protein B, partial [Methanocorpusculum sp.]|nr:ferrous iron transport protein B [Methanocorpusculum sp.]
MNKITFALVGNPNCGKTTLFNGLTGLRHHTGNWSGKVGSADRDEGKFTYKEYAFNIIDLPGVYSLSSRTQDEEFAAEYLLHDKFDVVVDIVDASHLEKNLFLTLQLTEIGIPVIVVLNMNKFAKKDGIFVDEKKLQEMLGVPVVRIEAVTKEGREELLDEIIRTHEHKGNPVPVYEHTHIHEDNHEHIDDNEDTHLHGPSDAEPHIHKLTHCHAKNIHYYDEALEFHIADLCSEGMTRWEAIQTLIHQTLDEDTHTFVTRRHLEKEYGGLSLTEIISSQKYRYITEILDKAVTVKGDVRERATQMIDKIVMNRVLALPIFLAVMFIMFQIVFLLGAPLQRALASFFSWLGELVSIPLADAPEWVNSLVVNGVIGGVGTVVSFLPNIILMFLLLAVLENSGYLSRVAVIMDSVMRKIGLHGKSFIPMILGFGCSVPAVMATRTLDNPRAKKLTMLLTPFMSCSARLPVYTLFVGVFFTANQGLMLFLIYIIGVVIALLVGLLLRKTTLKADDSAFIIEIPAYHAPRIRDTLLSMWDSAKEFLTHAGSIIFPAVLVVWLLGSLPFGVEYASMDSVLGSIGTAISPFFAPLGFGIPEVSVAIIMGLVSKEVVVGSLGSIYGAGEAGLSAVLPSIFTPLSAFSFMLFILLYIPCLATLLTIRRESGSWLFM